MLSLKESTDICKKNGFSSFITEQNANPKLAKSIGYYNAGFSLAPAKLSGYNVCAGSTPKCRIGCLGNFGRTEFLPKILQSRINRTRFLFKNQKLFFDVVEPQLMAVQRKAERLKLPVAFRCDILSDLQWHKIQPRIFESFPNWKFYGYTKIRSKIDSFLSGKNPVYQLYSFNEKTKLDYVKSLLKLGVNVAIPFYCKTTLKPTIPSSWQGLPVINGDLTDLRFKDKSGYIVGLKCKLPKSRIKAIKALKASKGFFQAV